MNDDIGSHLSQPATDETVSALVARWEDVRLRSLLSRQGIGDTIAAPGDYWAELELSTAIARQVTAGRWCAVAELLRLGAVESWAKVGDSLGMTETEAADGFRAWIAGQLDLNGRTSGRLGLTPAQAEQLQALADLVAF